MDVKTLELETLFNRMQEQNKALISIRKEVQALDESKERTETLSLLIDSEVALAFAIDRFRPLT